MLIYLSQHQRNKAELAGENLEKHFRETGRDKIRIDNRKPRFEQSILAEMAIAHLLGVPYSPPQGVVPDEGFDLIYNDFKIEVKSTEYPRGFLIMTNPFTADFATMVHVEMGKPYVKFVGWITREDFKKRKRPFTKGTTVNPSVPAIALSHPRKFKAELDSQKINVQQTFERLAHA